MDDNDYQSTGGSSYMNSEDELADSQKSIDSQDHHNQDQNDDQKGRVFKSEDLDTMVQNYKQIGGELLYNLKLLENKRKSLNKKLTDVTRECDILHQQKEFQMKTLVDLQIKLENLDAERIKIWQENEKDKTDKMDVLNNQLQSLLENDEYLRNTFDKFHDVLRAEKNNFDCLLQETRKESEVHKKAGESYIKEMREINQTFDRRYNDVCARETRLIEKLDQTVNKCKELITEELKLHEEIELYEQEYHEKAKAYSSLQGKLNETTESVTAIQEKYCEMEKSYDIRLDEINQNIFLMNKECDELTEEIDRQSRVVSEKNTILESINKGIKNINHELQNIQEENSLKEQELHRLNEEYNCIIEQLNQEKIKQNLLKEQVEELPSIEESLKSSKEMEAELQAFIDKLSEEEEARIKEVELTKEKHISIQENLKALQMEMEEWEIKVNEAEKEKADLIESMNQFRIDSANRLAEKNKEREELTLKIEQNMSIEEKLDGEISLIEKRIEELKLKMEEMTKEFEELDKEDEELKKREEEMELMKKKVELLEEDLVDVNKELDELKQSLAESREINDLENEINKIDSQIKEATLHYNGQIEAIESSYASQQQNLEEKYAKECKELEKRRAKLEARTKRMSEAVPRLTNDVGILEADLKKSFPSLIKEISSALETLGEVADHYYKLCLESRRKGSKASLLPTISAIEEQLAKPMKCMMSLEGVPKVNLDDRIPDKYKNVITAFRKKHAVIINHVDKNPPLEMAIKLQEIGSCVFGKKWVHKPTYSQAQNDAEISSSTTEIFY